MGRHPQKGDDGGRVDEFEPLTFVHICKCFMNQQPRYPQRSWQFAAIGLENTQKKYMSNESY